MWRVEADVVRVKRLTACVAALAACLSAPPAAAEDFAAYPDLHGPYLAARTIVGISNADGRIEQLPAGTVRYEAISPQPQENFGAGVAFGYRWSAWQVPLRAELEASWMYRHDIDLRAYDRAGEDIYYENNLRIWDARFSVVADVADFAWGRAFLGAGLGAAYLEADIERHSPPAARAGNDKWMLSPSLHAGLLFDRIFDHVDLELSYRYRWFGDIESGDFPGGETLFYDDNQIHEVRLGALVPFGW